MSRWRTDTGVFVILLALTIVVRAGALFVSVIDWDESLYALVARELIHGHLPYTTLWVNKPPGLFLIIAAGLKLFGTNVIALRLVADIAVALGAFLIYRLGTAFGENGRAIGIIAAIFYIAATAEGGGLATNSEIFLVPLLCAALLVVLQPQANRPRLRSRSAAWLGLWLGLALQVKETAIIESVAIVAIALLFWRIDVVRFTLIATMALLPTAIALGCYALAHQLAVYLDANLYSSQRFSQFIGLPPADVGLTMLREAGLLAPLPLLTPIAIAIGLVDRSISTTTRAAIAALSLWLAASFLDLLVVREYAGHQFVLLIPPMALLSAYALRYFASRLAHARSWVAAALAIVYLAHALPALLHDVRIVRERIATGNPAAGDEYSLVAQVVKEKMQRDRSLFVMHSQPVVYLLANADIPSRYAYPPFFEYLVQEKIAGIDGASEVRRVRLSKPHFLLTTYWVTDVDSRTLQAELDRLYPDYKVVYSRDRVILFELRALPPQSATGTSNTPSNLALGAPLALRADTLGIGTINGYVYGHRNSPVPSATVEVFQAQLDGKWTDTPYARRTTNDAGFFSFLGLPQGRYFVLAVKPGFQADCSPRLPIVSNALHRVTLHLRPKGSSQTRCPENAPEDNEILF